jgi:hypothetical protein
LAFAGVEPVKGKFIMSGMIIKQVSTLKYIGCGIFYRDNHATAKVLWVRRMLDKNAQKERLLKVHKVVFVPSSLCGSSTLEQIT